MNRWHNLAFLGWHKEQTMPGDSFLSGFQDMSHNTSNPSFSVCLKVPGVTLNSVAVYAGSRVFYAPRILVTFGDNAISHIFDAKNQKSVRFHHAFW